MQPRLQNFLGEIWYETNLQDRSNTWKDILVWTHQADLTGIDSKLYFWKLKPLSIHFWKHLRELRSFEKCICLAIPIPNLGGPGSYDLASRQCGNCFPIKCVPGPDFILSPLDKIICICKITMLRMNLHMMIFHTPSIPQMEFLQKQGDQREYNNQNKDYVQDKY